MEQGSDKWTRWYFAIVCALAFTIPLSQFASVRLLVVLSVGFFIFPGFRSRTVTFIRNSWEMCAYLAVLAIGLINSDDVVDGLRTLETSFSLIGIPLVFNTIRDFNETKLNTVYKFFAIGLTAACLICLSFAFVNYFKTGDISVFFFEELTEVINSQPTYFAYYLIFSIGFGLYMIYYNSLNVNRYALMAMNILFFLVLMLTGGRTAFVSLLLIFSFFVLKFLVEPKSLPKNMVFTAVILMLATLFAANYFEPLSTHLSSKNDYWERSVLWQSAMEANYNPIFGVGTGDYNTVLNQYLIAKGYPEFAADNYNAHNQFIQSYLLNGALGLITVLILLGRPLFHSIRNSDPLGMLAVFPFVIYGLTEVFLGRYQGVIFFAVLHQMTMIRNTTPAGSPALKVG